MMVYSTFLDITSECWNNGHIEAEKDCAFITQAMIMCFINSLKIKYKKYYSR